MARNRKMRRIVVDGRTFLWTTTHRHSKSPGECAEVFTAFLEDHKRSPLRIVFDERDGLCAGYPQAGLVWLPGPQTAEGTPSPATAELDLNLPSTAETLIRHALDLGWVPDATQKPYELNGGKDLVLQCDRDGPV